MILTLLYADPMDIVPLLNQPEDLMKMLHNNFVWAILIMHMK